CTAERKARDRLAMERHLGIANEIKDYGYYSVILSANKSMLVPF
ncbi:lipopolysaccharide core heptose(II) kinase RfaY, partial [Bacillus sp. HC-Mk]